MKQQSNGDKIFNQYDLALTAASFIRQNSTSITTKKLKDCKTQQHIADVFEDLTKNV
jgi:hypothetical protein